MADWGNLPKDIVTNIIERLELYEDFEPISQICSCWRSAAKEAKFRRGCNKGVESRTLPLLMLPERDESSNTRRLYSVSKRMVRHIRLPVADNSKKRLLSSNGWLLVVSERDNTLYLFEPFSRAIIKLPKLESIICSYEPRWYRKDNYVLRNFHPYKFTLSADPSTTSSLAVFLSCSPVCKGVPCRLYIWRNGEERWKIVFCHELGPGPELGPGSRLLAAKYYDHHSHDLTFYQGMFYGVDMDGRILKFDTFLPLVNYVIPLTGWPLINLPLPENRTSGSGSGSGSDDDGEIVWLHYLVESVGKLLVVRREIKCDHNTKKKKKKKLLSRTIGFEVLELDVNSRDITPVQSLGNRAVFIGHTASFSTSVDVSCTADGHRRHGFKPNCIYYTDDESVWKGHGRRFKNHCAYNLGRREFERIFYAGSSSHLGNLTQLMWVESPK